MGKGNKKKTPDGEVLVCSNPKARHRYEIQDRMEAGMVLAGSEVKSLRDKRGDLEGAYASFDHAGELWLHKMHIGPYDQAGPFGHEARRSRKLLLRKNQLQKLLGKLTVRGFALVPLRVYFKEGWAKIELGLGKGRKVHDDREQIRRQTDLKEARQAMRGDKG